MEIFLLNFLWSTTINLKGFFSRASFGECMPSSSLVVERRWFTVHAQNYARVCVNCRIIFLIIPSQCSCWITIFLNSSLWLPCAYSREILNFYYTIFFLHSHISQQLELNEMIYEIWGYSWCNAIYFITIVCAAFYAANPQHNFQLILKLKFYYMMRARRGEKFNFEVIWSSCSLEDKNSIF